MNRQARRKLKDAPLFLTLSEATQGYPGRPPEALLRWLTTRPALAEVIDCPAIRSFFAWGFEVNAKDKKAPVPQLPDEVDSELIFRYAVRWKAVLLICPERDWAEAFAAFLSKLAVSVQQLRILTPAPKGFRA